MAGRGRGAVLPAWMTASGAAGAPGAPAPAAPTHPGAAAPGSPGAAAAAAAARAVAARLTAQAPGGGPAAGGPGPAAAAPFAGGPGPAAGGFPGRAMPAGPGPAAAAGGAPPAAAQPKPEWTEHTAPDGRKYFFNTRTRQSAWEKPDELKTPAERAAAAASQPPAASAWKEHTAPDGRKYYYNRVTKQSVWTRPAEMGPDPNAPAAAAPAAAAPAAAPAAQAQVVKLQQDGRGGGGPPAWLQTGPTPHYSTTQEAKDAFKGLLLDAGVTSGMSWEEAMRLIVQDRRYGSLKTLGEKKTAFNEYSQARKREEAEEARQRRMQAKEGFYALLEGCAELAGDLGRAKFSRARDLLELDARWQAVDSNKEREELFEDWLEGKEREEKERRKAEAKAKRGALRELLERSAWVRFDTPWRKAQDRLAGEAAYDGLDKVDRLEVFEEYIRELERREREEREKEKEERRRQERLNRDAFRTLLGKHRAEGIINAGTRWKDYLPVVQQEPAYEAVEANASGSRPKELFLDALEEMEREYRGQRDALKALVKDRNVEVGVATTLEEFSAAVAGPAGGEGGEGGGLPEGVTETAVKLYWDELVGRAKEEAYRAEKKARRAKDDFLHMLKHMRGIAVDTTWEAAAELCKDEPEWRDLAGDEERRALFEEHLEKLKAKEAERADRKRSRSAGGAADEGGASSDEERREKKKKHKKEKKRHHDDRSDDDRRSKKHRRHGKDRSSRSKSRSRSRSRSREAEEGEL